MSRRAIIIGAGIGGIATANLLAKAGYEVTVYEKNHQPGGRAGLLEASGFRFDTGPSWYLMPEVFDHYFSLFGKSANSELDLIKLKPAYKVFFEHGDPLSITTNQETDAATFESVEKGAGEKLISYVNKGNGIYKLSLKHFLYTNFSSPLDFLKTDILKAGMTMLRLAFTPIDRYVQTYVKDLRLRQILEYPMVFLGSSPFSAPAIYSLMSALDFDEGVYYPQGGMYTIIEKLMKLSEELGVTYHYNTPVQTILTENGEAKGILLEDGTTAHADLVISNADLHFTETKLLAEKDRSYPEKYWKKQEAGPSALLMYLGVKGELPQLEHHNLFFTEKWEENFEAIFETKTFPHPASIYICKPSATDPSVAPAGHENVFVLVPFPPGVTPTAEETKALSETYLAQIEEHFKIPDLQDRIVFKEVFGPNEFNEKFNAWQNTALGPSHVLRQSAFFRTPNVSKKMKNLFYVGGFTAPGIGLPMCLIGAELIYKRLAGDKRGGPITSVKTIAGKK